MGHTLFGTDAQWASAGCAVPLGMLLGWLLLPPCPELGHLAHELVMSLSTHAPPAILVLGGRDIQDTSDKQMNLTTLSLPCFQAGPQVGNPSASMQQG